MSRATSLIVFSFVLLLVSGLPAKKAHALADLGDVGRGLFYDPGLGFMIPLGDDDFTDYVDVSFSLGVPGRVGYLWKLGPILIGPELSSYFTPGTEDDDIPGNLDMYRFRILGGVRIVYAFPRMPRLRIVGRVLIGIDVAWGEWSFWGGDDDDSSAGVGFEFSFGMEFIVHRRIAVGAAMGFPMAYHGDDFFGLEDYFSGELDYIFYVSIFIFP